MRGQIELTDAVQSYLADVSLREPDLLRQLRERTDQLPEREMQISPVQGQFLNLMVRAIGAKRTLEVGVFTGYSLLSVALALPPGGRIIGCDISDEWTSVAREYCARAGVEDRVELRIGDARQTLAALLAEDGAAGSFDFAFIDADKTGYPEYYEAVLALLRPGGLLAVDNVLRGGEVVDDTVREPGTMAIREFNARIHHDERVALSMLPIADGVTLAVKL
jgi:caffeoyl-CoA O-methyltransferase